MSVKIEKIISGGQTGGDMGGLLAGQDLGIPTAGYCPANWLTENGPTPELRDFGIQCTHAKGYPPRTRLNVAWGDGTIGFGRATSPGMKLTYKICKELDKPYLHFDYPSKMYSAENLYDGYIEATKAWIQDHSIYFLNVAGNRESKNHGIQEFVKKFLIRVIDD